MNLNGEGIVYCATFPADTQDITHWLIEINGIMSYFTNKVVEVLLSSENIIWREYRNLLCCLQLWQYSNAYQKN